MTTGFHAILVAGRHRLMSADVRRTTIEATHGVATIRQEEKSVELLRYAEGTGHEKGTVDDNSFNCRENDNNNKHT